MATNPSSIGSYKNTPYTGQRPVWPRKSQIRRGSYVNWHKPKSKNLSSR